MSDLPSVNGCKPPWVVFPDIQPIELSRYLKQGVTEAWFDQHWLPFWKALSRDQQGDYLNRWEASDPWREALGFYLEAAAEFDIEADARESEKYLEQWRKSRKK